MLKSRLILENKINDIREFLITEAYANRLTNLEVNLVDNLIHEVGSVLLEASAKEWNNAFDGNGPVPIPKNIAKNKNAPTEDELEKMGYNKAGDNANHIVQDPEYFSKGMGLGSHD